MIIAAKREYRRLYEKIDGRIVCLAILMLIGAIGLFIYRDYGISYDEFVELNMVGWHLDAVSAGWHWARVPGDLEYYGLFFNFISIAPYLLYQLIQTGASVGQIIADGSQTGHLYQIKHLATFLFSLIAYVSVGVFVRDLRGWKYAWIGIVLLALSPRFWGHSFFNPKDIPFAALFAITCWIGARFTHGVLGERSVSVNRRSAMFALAFGAFAGMLTGVRVGGFVVVGFAPLVLVTMLLLEKQRRSLLEIVELVVLYCFVLLSWIGTSILLSPVSWSSPAQWFVEAVTYHANHKWAGVMLAFGEKWSGRDAPWYYLPSWFGITTPIITLMSAVVGWTVTLIGLRKSTRLRQNIFIWLTLLIFALPLIAIGNKSTIYDGVRQFLFILPAIAVFGAIGLAWLWASLPRGYWRNCFVVVVALCYVAVAVDMVRLHPYEYVYFNNIVRAKGMEGEFDTDYWALSAREAMEWIESQPEPNKKVYYFAPEHSVESYSGQDTKLVGYSRGKSLKDIGTPFYYLCFPRNMVGRRRHPRDNFPQCETVFQVERELGWITLPLTIVKRCEQELEAPEPDRARVERNRPLLERNRARHERIRTRQEPNRARLERHRAHRERARARLERHRARRDSIRARQEQERSRREQERGRREQERSRREQERGQTE